MVDTHNNILYLVQLHIILPRINVITYLSLDDSELKAILICSSQQRRAWGRVTSSILNNCQSLLVKTECEIQDGANTDLGNINIYYLF